MAHGRSALRSGASLVAALVIAGTLSGAVAAAPSQSQRAGSTQQTQPAAAPRHARSAPTLSKRTAERRGSVDVRRMAAHKPAKRPKVKLPHLGLGGTAASGAKSGTAPKPLAAAAVGPPAPVNATTIADVAAARTSFPGLAKASDVFTASEPPDPWVAVGPEHVVQAVNLELRMTDRQGVDKLSIDLPSFFFLPTSVPYDTDPHVIYDSLHGRWLATEVSWDCVPSGIYPGTGHLDIATSTTSDPTDPWDVVVIDFPGYFPDYPGPGTSTDKVAVASNVYAMVADPSGDCLKNATFDSGEVDYLDWADLLNSGNAKVLYQFDPAWYSPRVAVQAPATSATLQAVAGFSNPDHVPALGTLEMLYFTVTGSVSNSTAATQAYWDLTTDDVVSGFAVPPQPAQPGGTISEAFDLRPTDAIWQGNRLVSVATYPCGTGPRDCVRVTELNTTGADSSHEPSLTQDFLLSEAGKDLFMGGVGLTGNGTLHVGWTRSSGTDNPSSYAAHQVVGDVANSIRTPELLAAGTGAYPGTRWGDYVGIAQDPQVPNQAWNANEYSVGAPGWATKVTPIRPAGTTYKPIAAVRVLDTRTSTGALKGGFTANTPRTWQVTNGVTIPNDAVAVTGNVAVTGQTAAGYVAITVTPTATPLSSTINFPLGDTRANNVTIPLAAGGKLSAVYKAGTGKKTQLVFDVTGYFVANSTGATFSPLGTPVRALDTRINLGLPGPFQASAPRKLQITGTGPSLGIPVGAAAITGNLAIVSPTSPGYAAVTQDPTATPATATINFPAKAVRANGVFATLDIDGALSIVYKPSPAGTTHMVLDITGYFMPGTGGLRFVPMTPSRIMDSRPAGVLSGHTGKFKAIIPETLPVQGHWGVPTDAAAVTGNLSVTGQTGAGYVSVTPDPTSTPATATINFPTGDTMGNGIVAPLSVTGSTSLVYMAGTGRTTDLILDLSGYFE